jgi:putative transposase
MVAEENCPTRRKPAAGVRMALHQPTIVFVTVCAERRGTWVAQRAVQETLLKAWSEAQAWLIGYYLLMPDHIHFFCVPSDSAKPFGRWMSYWKRRFTLAASDPAWRWQPLHWDTRLRRAEHYEQKWEYVRHNPVRAGLVVTPAEWPYQGMMNRLGW